MKQFNEFGLNPAISSVLDELGYKNPTPVQSASIPVLLEGHDLLAQAQTGTGKTAAFALPVLTKLDPTSNQTQALVLAPTRELAIQVAEAFKQYAKNLPGFCITCIYGGQEFGGQLRALKKGVHVVVGTPGRVMDHMRRGTLKLDGLKTLILDEADEMLKMGFHEDVEWILQQIPGPHQTALFSATIPSSIRKIAETHLKNPKHVAIQSETKTVSTIEQVFCAVNQKHKPEILTRFLAMEEYDGAIIFTQTKLGAQVVADALTARGLSAAAIHGDLSQDRREQVINRIKEGLIDIVVATDVAARGLDVTRVSLVINYDIPFDSDTYTHRIGRTGRAGRAGKALTFVTGREQGLFRRIERETSQRATEVTAPSVKQVQSKLTEILINKVIGVLQEKDLSASSQLFQTICQRAAVDEKQVASAILYLAQGSAEPMEEIPAESMRRERSEHRGDRNERHDRAHHRRGRFEGKRERGGYDPTARDRVERGERGEMRGDRGGERRERRERDDSNMTSCRIDIGRNHGVTPSEIVGVLANRGKIDRKNIGKITILDGYSLVDLDKKCIARVVDRTRTCKLKGTAVLNTRVATSA